MRITISFAILLAATILPARAQSVDQTTTNVHGGHASHFAAFGPFRTAHRTRGSAGSSTSRGCLTAQTRQVLAGLESRFGGVKVISTCRAGAVIAGSVRPSQHRYGKAVDFMPSSGQRGAMLAWLRANAGGAVITYGSGHIHFDTGGYRNFAVSAKARRTYARAR